MRTANPPRSLVVTLLKTLWLYICQVKISFEMHRSVNYSAFGNHLRTRVAHKIMEKTKHNTVNSHPHLYFHVLILTYDKYPKFSRLRSIQKFDLWKGNNNRHFT